MLQRFTDRIVLVTGGAGGLGRAIARRFHAEGAAVAVLDRDAPRALAVAGELGDRAMAVCADVTDVDGVERAVDQVLDGLGGLDVVVANAGIAGRVAAVHELDPAAFDDVVAINLRGVFLTVRAGLRAMIARSTRGTIVTMGSSMVGWDVLAGSVGYVASKHAVVGLTRAAALDAAAHGIRSFGGGRIAVQAGHLRTAARRQDRRLADATAGAGHQRHPPGETGPELDHHVLPQRRAGRAWPALTALDRANQSHTHTNE